MNNHPVLKRTTRRWTAIVTAIAFAAFPTLAAAESCEELKDDRAQIESQVVDLVANNAGIHIIIGLCGGIAQKKYDDTKDPDQALTMFVACAAIGCAFAGVDDCANVATEWFRLGMKHSQIEDRMRELPDCQP